MSQKMGNVPDFARKMKKFSEFGKLEKVFKNRAKFGTLG